MPSIGETTVRNVVLDRDLDTEAAEAAASLNLEVAIQIWRQVGAMRVERRQHPGDSTVDKPLGRDWLDIILLHDREHVREGLQFLVGIIGERLGALHRQFADHQEANDQRYPHRNE